MSTDTAPTFREQFHDLATWLRTPKGILVASIAILLVIGMIGSTFDSGDETETRESVPTAPAPDPARSVNADASGIQLSGTGRFEDCRMAVNSGVIRGGWTYRNDLDYGAGPITVSWGLFTKRDGERFDPFSYRPESLSINCAGGSHGYWEW